MQRSLLLLAFLAAVILVACTPSEPPPSTNVGVWGETTVVEELSIGIESGPGEYMFGLIVDLDAGPDGTIFVTDSQPTIVRVYSSAGVFLRDIGRAGEGPGEYSFAPILDVLPNGDLGIWDSGNGRVSIFSGEGTYKGSFRAASQYSGGPRGLQHDGLGNIYVFALESITGPVQSRADLNSVLLKYSSQGDLLDTLPLPSEDVEGQVFTLPGERLRPFTVVTNWAWSPNGYLAVGRGDRYSIEVRDGSRVIQRVTRDIKRVRLTQEERAEWQAFREAAIERIRVRLPSYDPLPIPDAKPYFRGFFVGDDGRIWVHRYVAAVKRDDVGPDPTRPERPVLTWREPITYDVFDPDGTFLGSAVVPEGLRPFVFRGEQIWGSLTDDDGMERVVRLRVVPEGE